MFAGSLAHAAMLIFPSRGPESLIELLWGQPLAGLGGYAGHGSLLSEVQNMAYTCHLTKEAGLEKTPRKGQKSN